MEQRVIYEGIEIIATDEFGDIEVFFSNAQGSFELSPSDNIPPLEGFKSLEEAVQHGKKFVREHRWQLTSTVGLFKIYVRKWWNDKWGYSIRSEGATTNDSGFNTREEAIEVARVLTIEKLAELRSKAIEIDMGKNMRLIFA